MICYVQVSSPDSTRFETRLPEEEEKSKDAGEHFSVVEEQQSSVRSDRPVYFEPPSKTSDFIPSTQAAFPGYWIPHPCIKFKLARLVIINLKSRFCPDVLLTPVAR